MRRSYWIALSDEVSISRVLQEAYLPFLRQVAVTYYWGIVYRPPECVQRLKLSTGGIDPTTHPSTDGSCIG